MGEYDNIDWAKANYKLQRMPKPKKKQPPKEDREVSRIVGRSIPVNDPRLIKLGAEWSRKKSENKPAQPFHKDPRKVEQLKRAFNA